MKILSAVLVQLLLNNINNASAFSTSLQRRAILKTQQTQTTRIFSQWDDDEEDVAVEKPKSFDDAQQGLKDEDDKEKMDEMGDYDANPAYNSSDLDRVREAIKQRTESLGIEKSTVSAEAIQAAEERAKSGIADRGSSFQQLDLSQISQEAPRDADESQPAMFYEPEAEMTEEEMKEADPDGQLGFADQAMKEIGAATWPTAGAALKEVILLITVVITTSSLIIGWDGFLRDTYTNAGFIPRQEDVMKGTENMALPEGWTNGMSEDDFMNFQDEVGSSSSSSSPSVSQFQDL